MSGIREGREGTGQRTWSGARAPRGRGRWCGAPGTRAPGARGCGGARPPSTPAPPTRAAAAPPRTPPPRRERETGRRAAGEDPPWFRTGTALAAGRGLRAGERTWTLLSSPVKTDADRPMDGPSGLFFLSLDTDRYANQLLFFTRLQKNMTTNKTSQQSIL